MSLQKYVVWVLLALLVSVGAMTWTAAADHRLLNFAAGAFFAVAAIMGAVAVNRPHWRSDRVLPDTIMHAARRNARLMALTYEWGALSLLGMYWLAPLSWRHGWQYAVAMLLVAALLVSYVKLVGYPRSSLRRPAMLRLGSRLGAIQGALALGGLVGLVASGKLGTRKADWAANHVFVIGALTIAAISAIAFFTHRHLEHKQDYPRTPAAK
ncbi:MAG: hypothetical protein AB7E70_11465 [Hyphomicrobiaceae bacterium]